MRIFITGATGFAGSHLVSTLLAAGHDVFGLVHAATTVLDIPNHPRFYPVDGNILDLKQLTAQACEIKPDVIYHLAGQAFPGRSWENAAWTLAINSGGTANLLEAALAVGKPRVVVVTSAEIYGKTRPSQLPLTERTKPKPRHPYGVSKHAAGQLVSVFHQRYGLPVIEARPFNHIGPNQAQGFVVPDFASQVARIKLDIQKNVMRVGNLEAARDFTDVRDVVNAYIQLATAGKAGESYLICSGQAVKISTILNILLEISGLEVSVEQDPARMRPSDVPILYGSYEKIKKHTGWMPQIHLRQSLADVYNYWLTQADTLAGS